MTETGNFSAFRISSEGIPLITWEVADILSWCISGVLSQVVNIFGIVTNVINIICFVKQDFKEPINVSLLGLSISDLGSLITQMWTNCCLTPVFKYADAPFDVFKVSYVTGSLPHLTFARVSTWITAIITMERCLCIILPLQVKNIVTSQRVCVIIICIYLGSIATAIPVFAVNRLGMVFFLPRNKSILAVISADNHERVEQISFIANNFVVPFAASTVIIICTIIIVINLRIRAKWHKDKMISSQKDISGRHEKVAKMVLMISILFISCFVPVTIVILVVAFEPDLYFTGKDIMLSVVLYSFGLMLESINSSMNIFIYYHGSSKYRDTFNTIFCKGKSE